MILISLAQIILPKGKISVAATGILSIVIIFCFLKPLNTLSFDVGTREEQTNINSCGVLSDFVEICDKKLTKTEIYLSNPVMSDESEHININVITDYIANLLGLQREILTVYG